MELACVSPRRLRGKLSTVVIDRIMLVSSLFCLPLGRMLSFARANNTHRAFRYSCLVPAFVHKVVRGLPTVASAHLFTISRPIGKLSLQSLPLPSSIHNKT